MLKEKIAESQAYGNAEVIELLEGWLELAREGKMCHVTLVAQELPDKMAFEAAGVAGLECAVPIALDLMKIKLWEDHRRRSGPKPNASLGADYVCYNLGIEPISFDFLNWLISAEMNRVREGAPAPLKVAFTRGQDGQAMKNNLWAEQMYANVMRPLVPMIGGIVDNSATFGRKHNEYLTGPIVERAKAGEPVPKLTAPDRAMELVAQQLEGKAPITITLRELATWEHRNSNLEAWLRFAKDLEAEGETVVIVRDSTKAHEPIKDFNTYPLASTNLHVRQALYEQSKLNLFVPNGPWNLALYGTRPWLCFNAVSRDDPFHLNWPSTWKEQLGLAVGEQFPWSLPSQRLIWEKADTYENICDAYAALG